MENLQQEIDSLRRENIELMRLLDEANKRIQEIQKSCDNQLLIEPTRRRIVPKNV